MNPLDVCTLDEAKAYLKIDFDDDDTLITSLIYAAVAYVEQVTKYRLYNRIEYEYSDGTYPVPLPQTPLNSVTITNVFNTPIEYAYVKRDPVRSIVEFRNYNGWYNFSGYWGTPSLPLYTITLDVGYTNIADAPITLVQAVKTIVAYMYENRDAYNKANYISRKVLVWVVNQLNNEPESRFARYHHLNKIWSIDGITGGKFVITHFTEINSPLEN